MSQCIKQIGRFRARRHTFINGKLHLHCPDCSPDSWLPATAFGWCATKRFARQGPCRACQAKRQKLSKWRSFERDLGRLEAAR